MSRDSRPSNCERRVDLTHREWDVCRLICLGSSAKVIAAELGLSIHTVRRHMEHIYRKLDVQCRSLAVIRILEAHQSSRELVSQLNQRRERSAAVAWGLEQGVASLVSSSAVAVTAMDSRSLVASLLGMTEEGSSG